MPRGLRHIAQWYVGWAVTDRNGMAPATGPDTGPAARFPAAVLFDRDGTLVFDVPYNGDPRQVRPMPGARAALDRLRGAGVPVGVVSNQSGIGRGLVTAGEVAAVNDRVEQMLGPFGAWEICPHRERAGCTCRKPAPGMIVRAARRLGVEPRSCAVIGDIGSDMAAAAAAGALGVLVPTPTTRAEEVAAAPVVAADLASAVGLLLGAGRSASEPLLRPAVGAGGARHGGADAR